MKKVGVLSLQGDFAAHGAAVQRAGALPVYVRERSANSPSNQVASENPFRNEISAPAEASNKSLAGAAPVTVKLDPGSDRNEAVTLGSDQ